MSAERTLSAARTRSAWLFLSPALAVMLVVAAWPLLRTLWFSLTDADMQNMSAAKMIGFGNYVGQYGVLDDPDWWRAVVNTLAFTLVSVSIETVLGIIVALVLNVAFPGRALVRAAVLIPWAIPTVVSAKMWGWMLNDQFGLINHILTGLHLVAHPIAWTANPNLALLTVVIVDVWKTTPFMALLILAGLQTLPGDCYEAARVDGIHPVRVFFRVTLPLIRQAVMVAMIFRGLDALRVFDLVYVLTSNSNRTMTMSVYARDQLVGIGQVGYGSAASTVLFLMVAFCAFAFIRFGRVNLGEQLR
jgi:trehalose/maltose transport system permease protein